MALLFILANDVVHTYHVPTVVDSHVRELSDARCNFALDQLFGVWNTQVGVTRPNGMRMRHLLLDAITS